MTIFRVTSVKNLLNRFQVDFYDDRFVGTNFTSQESYAEISRSMGGQVTNQFI